MSSVNKVILIGHVGGDPEQRAMQSGKPVASFSLATSESWKGQDGQRQEKTTWHRIVCFSEGLCRVIQQYVRKGSKLYIEGQIANREYEKDGQTHKVSEIVLQGFNSTLVMLDAAERKDIETYKDGVRRDAQPLGQELDDSIPF